MALIMNVGLNPGLLKALLETLRLVRLVKCRDRHHGLFCLAAAFLSKHQLLAKCKIRRGKPMVEDEVNEDAGDRDIEPDRHRPTADPAVSIPAALKSRYERDDYQRQRDKRE